MPDDKIPTKTISEINKANSPVGKAPPRNDETGNPKPGPANSKPTSDKSGYFPVGR